MIKEIVTPKDNKIQIEIPDEFINEELEVLVFPTKDTIQRSENKELQKTMKELFKNAPTIKIEKDIDIDNLMHSMNDALS